VLRRLTLEKTPVLPLKVQTLRLRLTRVKIGRSQPMPDAAPNIATIQDSDLELIIIFAHTSLYY
jgi:hypothetical protein